MNKEMPVYPETIKPERSSRSRLQDIDRAKGLMMIFVVVGHVSDPLGPEWANTFRALIYGFHMPFFMYLSGYIFSYTGSHLIKRRFVRYVLNRANRLLVPFLAMAFVIINLKLISAAFMTVNKPVDSIWSAYESIFINTSTSPALAIWYLFVLFVFSIVTPLVYKVSRNTFAPIWIVAFAMYGMFFYAVYNGGLTDDFYISRMFWFYIFFISGCAACEWRSIYMPFVRRAWPLCLIAFVTLDYVLLDTEWRYLIVGLVSAPALHGLMGSRFVSRDKLFLFLGDYSMVIYLFNTVFIGLVRGGLGKMMLPGEHMFVLYAISLFAGLGGPIIAKTCLAWILPRRIIANYLT